MDYREASSSHVAGGGMTAWTRKLGSYLFRGHRNAHRAHDEQHDLSQSNSSATREEAHSEVNVSDAVSVTNSEDRSDMSDIFGQNPMFGGLDSMAHRRVRSLLTSQPDEDDVAERTFGIELIQHIKESTGRIIQSDEHSSGSDSSDYGELEDDDTESDIGGESISFVEGLDEDIQRRISRRRMRRRGKRKSGQLKASLCVSDIAVPCDTVMEKVEDDESPTPDTEDDEDDSYGNPFPDPQDLLYENNSKLRMSVLLRQQNPEIRNSLRYVPGDTLARIQSFRERRRSLSSVSLTKGFVAASPSSQSKFVCTASPLRESSNSSVSSKGATNENRSPAASSATGSPDSKIGLYRMLLSPKSIESVEITTLLTATSPVLQLRSQTIGEDFSYMDAFPSVLVAAYVSNTFKWELPVREMRKLLFRKYARKRRIRPSNKKMANLAFKLGTIDTKELDPLVENNTENEADLEKVARSYIMNDEVLDPETIVDAKVSQTHINLLKSEIVRLHEIIVDGNVCKSTGRSDAGSALNPRADDREGDVEGENGRGPDSWSADESNGSSGHRRRRRVSFKFGNGAEPRVSEGESVRSPGGFDAAPSEAATKLGTPHSISPKDFAILKNQKESTRRKMYLQGYSKEEVDKCIGHSELLDGLDSPARLAFIGDDDTFTPEEIVNKYAKYYLLRVVMKRPVTIVREIMTCDGFETCEIDRFIALTRKARIPTPVIGTPSPSRSSPSRGHKLDASLLDKFEGRESPALKEALHEDPKFEKYRKMQKLNIPEGAIRQKMTTEAIPCNEIEAFFLGPVLPLSEPVAEPEPTDDPKFEKFRKMQKMGLPEGAIRQKMSVEGISLTEQEIFFSGKPAAAEEPATEQPAEDPKFEKFRKMQKMNLPEGAIRQKMNLEGISAAEQDEFFNGKRDEPPQEEDPRFEKFRKMKKMNLPEGAIRQKMTAEGISVAEQDAFFNGKPVAPVSDGSIPMEDPKFAKFRNMQKMKLPEGAIRQKMVMDGLSADEIAVFFSSDGTSNGATAGAEAALIRNRAKHEPTRKMRNVYITKLSGKELESSLWATVDEIACDWTDLELNFGDVRGMGRGSGAMTMVLGVGSGAPGSSEAGGNTVETKPKPVLLSLFDGKRTQNTSIFITSCRKSVDELYSYAVSMSPDMLTKDMTLKLLVNAPTDEEAAAVAPHDADVLDTTGKLFKKLAQIPRLKQRLEIQSIIFNYDTRADEIVNEVNCLSSAVNEVQDSLPLIKQAFAAILSVVNYLNAGTPRAQAIGMKIEDLKKLSDVKPVSGAAMKGSLLHYVDNVIYSGCGSAVITPKLMAAMEAAPAPEDVLKAFCDGWTSVFNCNKISIKQLLEVQISEQQQLINVCRDELAAVADMPAEFKHPLCHRIAQFVDHADTRLQEIEKQARHVESQIKQLRCTFGENETASNGECISMSFFGPFVEFATYFAKVHADNNRLRIAEFKKSRKAQQALMPKKEAGRLHTQSAARMKAIRSRLASPSAGVNSSRTTKAGSRSPRRHRAHSIQSNGDQHLDSKAAKDAMNTSETTDESEGPEEAGVAEGTEGTGRIGRGSVNNKRMHSHRELDKGLPSGKPTSEASNALETTDESEEPDGAAGNDENVPPSNTTTLSSAPTAALALARSRSNSNGCSPSCGARMNESPTVKAAAQTPTRRSKLRRNLSDSSNRSRGSVRSSSRTPSKRFLQQRPATDNMFAV